jgi:GNAT superfamily N-acetyltransferase
MALPAGYVLVEPKKVKLPAGYTLVGEGGGLPSIAKSEPREAPAYDPLGQVIGDVPAPLDYEVQGKGRMNEPGALTTLSDLVKQFIAPGVKAPFALPQATETAVKGLARQSMEGSPEALMPSSVFQPGLDTEETLFGPETDVQKARRKLQAQRAVAAMPSIPGAAALNKIGENVQKDILGSLSPEAKKALQESQITGNIFKGEVDFGKNPTAYGYVLQAANVFGSMAPVIATALVTKSPAVGGYVGGTMAADEAATSAAEFINKIPDADLRIKSPFYAELIAGGASPKEARELTIKKAAESGAALQGLVATFGDVLTGKLVTGAFNNTIAKLGTNRLVRAGGVGAASSLEESLQEVGEGLASDVTLKNVIPSKELGEDSAANLILGALGGAGPGVIKGALSEGEAKAPEREKYVQPEGGLAELMARQRGFLTPEGRPPAPPAAPAAQAPMPPAPPAGPAETIQAPESESRDTQAMLQELINSVNYPAGKAPEVKAEKPAEEAKVETPTFDATGWTKSERTINKKTGEPNLPEGVERYTKEDEDGTSRRVITRNGEVTQLETTTPTIELTNSLFGDEGETISGRIKANELNGTLYFFPDSGGPVIKMSPRASQQYKEGVPANKIAELEFSDAGGIRPDGTKTPHTTTSVIKTKETSNEQPASTKLIKEVLPEAPEAKARPSTPVIYNAIIDGWQGNAGKLPKETLTWMTDNGLIKGGSTTPLGQRLMDTVKQAEEAYKSSQGVGSLEAIQRGEPMPIRKSMSMDQVDEVVDKFLEANKPKTVKAPVAIEPPKEKASNQPQGKDATLYHGTNAEYDEIDPSKSGGMAFFGEDESVGARYAQNGGGGRARLDDSQKYIVNSNGVVYELEGDLWKAVGIAPEEGLINKNTIQSLDKVYPSLSQKEAERMTNPDSGSAGVVPKSSRIIKKDFSGLNLLDISTPEGRDVIAGLKPKTQTGIALVEAAQFDARDKRDRNSTTQLNSNFWGITKYAAAKGQQLRADIVDPLKAMGYDGIQFQDDQHKSVGLFDTGLKKEKQQKKKIEPTTTPETREEYPALSKTEVEELGLAPKPKVEKPKEPKIDYLNHPDNVGSDASSKREFDNKGKLQVAPQNIADGGTPFKSRAAADAARKNYPDMRVLPTADKKGFILAPKTPKQIEADKAKAKRLGLPMTTTKGTPMAAHQFITSEGGITKAAMKDLGMDENVRSGNRSLFTDSGMSMEQAYIKLQEAGYLEEGATQNDARNLITESVKKPKYRQQDTEEMAERAELADYADYLKAEEEASLYSPVDEEMGYEIGDFEGTGYEGASPEVQAEVRALLAQADALGINTESIREEIFYETENQSIQAYYKAFKSALEDAIARSRQDRIEDTGQPGGEGAGFELTAPTADEIRTKQAETERRAKEEERAKKAAEDKAKADEQAAEFTLTGSDRAADVAAARGQKDIFAEDNTFNPVELGEEFPEIGAEAFAYLDTTNSEVRKAIGALYKKGDIDGAIAVLENMPKNVAVVEKPKDNKQEIADLRKEQKSLMLQIIKAGMTETPEQESRMIEIEKRITELEGKPAKPVVKQRSVAEIEEELQDLEDELDGEILKEKRSPLIARLTRLEGELDAAKGRAKRAAAEAAPTEAETEAAEEAAEEAIRNKAEAEIDEGPIGQAIAKIENGDIETKAQIRTFIKKLERDGVLDDVEDVREGLSDREQDASEVLDTLSGLLDDARDNAIDERFDELLEESAQEEVVEEPSFEVETPEGNTLTYPAAYGLVNTGYTVLSLNDPRTYTDKGGTQHRTFEKDGARIAVSPNQVLFEWKGRVQYGMGNPNELTLEMLAVDPKDRGKGKGTQVLKDLTKVADQYGITLYGEPVPIVNLKQNDVGLDFDQLVNLYKKFDFKFQETDGGVSNRVIVREPEVEVLPAEEPQIAGQVGFEPYTIEGDFTEVAEEQQRLMLEDQTENLSDDQVSTLEKHYGAKADSDEFFTKLREDVSNFIVKGAAAVNGKIRAIIRQLANGVLAVGIAFNPQYMSQPLNVIMPIDNVRTEEVLAMVPDAATDKMSEPAKRAYAVIYPALQEQMQAKDKLFIMADKPSGRVFVFNPDGSLLLEKKSLFGLAKGDIYVGDNEKPQNRITPAGLFDLKFVDAQKGESEKRTAGDYDTGTVLAINDPEGTITIMHSVWLKEKDSAQRAAALRNESPADSRYSFGCINVDAPTYKFLVNNHAKQMDGAALFIVPEAGVDVMSFITGKGAMSEDLARIKIKPVTKTVKTTQKQATQAEAKTKTPGRERQFFSLESPNSVQVNGRSIPVTKHKLEKNNQIVKVDVNAFDDAFSKTQWQYIGEGGKGGIGDRYKNFGKFIANAKSIEAPNVAVNKDGSIVFGDGRHRYAYLRDAGVASIPLSMDAESIKNAQKFGYISDPINKSLGDELVKLTDQMAGDMAEDEKKRSPSLKRTLKTYNRQRKAGKMSDEMYVMMSDAAIREDEERRMAEEPEPRKRGYLHIQNRLNEAVQAGDISREAYDLANWFMLQNEALVDDLGISIKANKREGAGGFYHNLARIFTLIKKGGSDLTATHEILHHLERMMPLKIQQAIRKAWLTQLIKAAKATKDPVQKLYFEAVLDANFGDNKHAMVNVPEGAGVAYSNARMALEDMDRGNTSVKLAEMLLLQGAVPLDMYQFFNPSEFWAVNGSRIVEGRFEAVKGGTLAKLKNWLRELGQTVKSIFGLKSDASIIRALDSLAKSDGKFVTDEMLSQGDYQSIERRNYEGGEAPEPDMEIPEMSFMDDVIYKYGDKLIDTKRLIQSIKSTGKKLNEQFDAYMKEENYHGRLAKRTDNFLNDEMRPVLEDMQEKGVTLDELETFLLNRHAKEANAYIARINPTGFPEAGSSVSDADADAYMAALTPEKRKDLIALAAKVDKIVKETQRVLVANGLETQDTIDEWNATYKNYVPLMRDQLDFVHTGRGVMGGFATRGSASKRRVGSDKPVIDIFANIAMQRERALRRSEQARVGRALYGMAIKHPNPGFWLAINPDAIKDKDKLEAELISLGLTPEDAQNIIQEPRQPMFDKKTGTVKYQVNPLLRNSPNVFPVRINGEDRFIFFNPNDPRALRMVESIKNLDTERLGDVIGTVGMVTRWFASVNTQYNIVFGGVNFLRDLGAASLNLSTTEIAGKEKQVRANVLPALRAIYRDLRGKGATTEAMAEMQDWFERFQLAGGQTGYQNQFAETKRKGNVVEQELKRLNRGNVKKAVDSVFDWLSDYNDAIENAVRLSAFKVAVESGLSEDKAASIAKNLTVNFNRKGARTGLISSLYAFFNAAIQGSARMMETLRGPMGKKIIFGGMFLGSMQAVVLAMAGFDDDEPPEFVKDKNLIIPIPFTDKKYLSVPMPLGFNMFPGFGRLAMETLLIETGMIRSRKGPGDKVMSAVSLVFDAFNPLGGAGNPLLMAMPTILDPFAAIYSNRDSFGRPIYKEDKGTAPTPGYERSRENSSLFSKKLAEAINWATSPAGTQHTKGFFSPTADQIDYFIGQVTGGVGREIMKVGEFAKSKAVTQEEVPAYKLPIVGRFYGEAESPAATRSRFYENVKEMAKHEYEIKGLRKDRTSPAEYIKANPEARLWQRANNVENQIVKLNKEKKALIEKDAPREAVKRKEDEILRKMTEFNNQVRRGQ